MSRFCAFPTLSTSVVSVLSAAYDLIPKLINGPTLNAGLVAAIFQGIRTCIARKPYIFVIFQGGFGPPAPPPSGSAYAVVIFADIIPRIKE